MSAFTKRFLSLVEIDDDGCWHWKGFVNNYGYGLFNENAHRLSYELFKGSVPAAKVVDHICRVRDCVNPKHLRVLSRQENIFADGSLALAKKYRERTHCKHGHEFTTENTIPRPEGGRRCRICKNATSRRYIQNKKLDSLKSKVV